MMESDRMHRQRYRQQLAHSPSRRQQLFAVHLLPDKTELVTVPESVAYTGVWDAASKLSRSRRVFAAASDLGVQPRHPHQYTSSGDGTMRVNVTEGTDSRGNERMTSSAGSELGDWINKYQKSDHHGDRLVRTIVHYEQTTGQRFPDSKLIPANYHEIKRNHVSALPDVVYIKTPPTNSQPVTYELPTVRRPSIDYSPLATASNYGISSSVSVQPQRSSAISVSSRRPPVAPKLPLDVSRSTSLPPSASGDILHRRRRSISSAYNAPVRVTVQRYASPAPPSVSTIRQGEPPVTAYRRASYSGASPNYRSHVVSRHTTPDRVLDEEASRYLAGRLDFTTTGWSTRSRSASPAASAANNYILQTIPGTPRMSEARKKIRKVLNKLTADDY